MLKNEPTRAPVITPPPELPGFAAFAVSAPSDPVPELDPAEASLVTEGMVPERRTAFARGRDAAHRALRSIGAPDGPITVGPLRQPLWPDGVVGSISHAAGFAVALVAPSSGSDGVGVDIERLRFAPELDDEVPTPRERSWLATIPTDDRDSAVLALFSAKESIYKAFFPRYRAFFGFDAATLRPRPGGFSARLTEGIDADYPPSRAFDVTCDWFGDVVLTSVVLPPTDREVDAAATEIPVSTGRSDWYRPAPSPSTREHNE